MSSAASGNAAPAAGSGDTSNANNSPRRQPRGRWPQRSTTKHFRSSIVGLEDAVFDIGPHVKPDQFTRSRHAIENHILTTYNDPRDIIDTFRNMAPPSSLVEPTRPKKDPLKPDEFELDAHIYKVKYQKFVDRETKYKGLLSNAWGLIYGQCSRPLRNQLEGADGFQQCKLDSDIVTLLNLIEGFCSKLDRKSQGYYAVAESFKRLCVYFQPDNMSNDDYYQQFKSMVRVLETYAGDEVIGHLPLMTEKELKIMADEDGTFTVATATTSQRKEASTISRNKFLAALMLSGSNLKRYDGLRKELSNSFAMGIDKYPSTMEEVLDLLNTYKPATAPSRPAAVAAPAPSPADAIEEQAMFAQDASRTQTCRDCGETGHVQQNCPQRRNNRRPPAATPDTPPPNAQVHAMVADETNDPDDDADDYDQETMFFQNTSVIGDTKILLDNQSTISQFASMDLLTNIRPASRPVKVHCNAGSTVTTLEGDFGNFTVFYDEHGIANILSLKDVAARHRVTYDSWDRGGVFIVHTPTGKMEFHPTEKGLHSLDLNDVAPADVAAMLVNTVADNYEGFSKREVLKAHEARRFQRMIAVPSERDYVGLVREKLIANCPVTSSDVQNAHQIFGPDLAGLRGKTVRQQPEHVRTDYVEIPRDFMDRHRNVTLTADVMFVNGIPFLITLSRGINLVTIEYASTRTAMNLSKLLQRAITAYTSAGLKVQTVMMDMEFHSLHDLMPQIVVNTTAANEHVAEIERRIRVVKERARSLVNTLPYPRLPKRIIVELLYFITMWLNAFPVKNGISQKWSPRELLRRHKLDARLHCRAEFGAYCEVHDEPSPSNTLQRRTHAAICLGPTGNLQGSYKFFCLTTGKKLVRRNFTVMPGVPDVILKAVDKFAVKENRPMGLAFRNRHKESFAFSNDDLDDILVEREPAPYPDIPNVLPSVATPVPTVPHQPHHDDRDDVARQAAHNAGLDLNVPIVAPDDDDDDIGPLAVPAQHHQPQPHDAHDVVSVSDDDSSSGAHPSDASSSGDDANTSSDDDDDTSSDDDDDNNDVPAPSGRPSRRTAGTTSRYDDYHVFTTAAELDLDLDESTMAMICHYIMVHYSQPYQKHDKTHKPTTKKKPNVFSLNAGLKRFGDRGATAVSKELTQFNMLNTFIPLDAKTLTPEQRRTALASLIFLTEKRNGDIKARACANGKPQRQHIAKDETTSPTVTNEANFALAAIAAKERRYVATMDLPGAFLHADNDSFVVMKMTGKLAELMVTTAPNIYRKYVIEDASGRPILYVQLQKALYGMLKSALLFYRKLVADLLDMGFTLNPYDPCVANKTVRGSQLTVSWHVDDLMLSCVDRPALQETIQRLKAIYGPNLKETIGPVHDYLGMTFDYSVPGEVQISMDKYIANIIDSFPEEITGVSATPATDKLFLVRDDDRPLPEAQAVMFHHVTARLLFASTRVRRDIQTTVAFLTTRVKQPGEDDWGKLKRVLKYLNGTRRLHLTLTVDSLSSIKWYVDGSHQIHDDCRGHTGAMMTLGKGAVVSSSRKQKINTKSSTETELVAVDDKIGDILWMRYFLESQGYTIEQNIIYQDNMSTLSLEKNGRISGSNRTKHIKAKYYLVQDKYRSKEIDLQYCPTNEMWADVLTKPLQGQKFREMRSFLMNCPIDYSE